MQSEPKGFLPRRNEESGRADAGIYPRGPSLAYFAYEGLRAIPRDARRSLEPAKHVMLVDRGVD
jgi:hypothetical protein